MYPDINYETSEKQMRRRILYIVTTISLFLAGCLNTSIIDEIMILSVLGIDYLNEQEIKMTGSSPVFIKDQPVRNIIHQSIIRNDKHTIDELQKSSNFEIKLGSLIVTLFNREFAEKEGLIGFLLYLKREPYIGSKLYPAIVEGDTHTLLETSYGERGNGFFLQNLIKHNIDRHDLPKTNLHVFLYDYYQQGQDPYLPIIKKIGPKELQINGVALFKGDKMVHKVPNEDLFFLKLLIDEYTDGSFRLHQEGTEIDYEHVRSKMKVKLKSRNPYVIEINLNLKGTLRDYMNGELNKKNIERAENLLKEKVEKEMKKLLVQFQELNIDPAGIGAFVKSRTRGFDFKNWEDEYQRTQFHINSDVLIRDTGILE